ncbi:phytanoyl-CoA dioxygenase family protein [Cochlodiniinecator piscidefendens]|uniref:phytanoyl-CoA dioxygenase family protein n=1 Tax=Cochlodiniinecator piscidefendens TaxID=2715756 RepID=UPI001407A6A4|nr:phytanoyl-CoA dioxygenase family protein [Cochlodiniinecator piscidefendens]
MTNLTKDVKDLQDEYKENGVVVVRRALTEHWIGQLQDAVEEELKRGDRYFAYRNMRKNPGIFQDFCLNSGIGRVVADIGGADWSSLVFDQMFVKEPGTKTQTGWHTDQPYWPISGPIMTTWIALDPVDSNNGALEFIPRSHASGKKYRPFTTDKLGGFVDYMAKDDPQYIDMPDFEAEREQHEMVHWDLEPGDLLAFDGYIVHSAMGNRTTTRRRRGYAVRFALEGAQYTPSQGVADWLEDDTIAPGAPYKSDAFPEIFRR